MCFKRDPQIFAGNESMTSLPSCHQVVYKMHARDRQDGLGGSLQGDKPLELFWPNITIDMQSSESPTLSYLAFSDRDKQRG